ncbi:MAG: Sugar-specific transcriptional regulator TrmB [Candidatus Parcubacteria bacterium]|jgi:predicted transcriptional regulator
MKLSEELLRILGLRTTERKILEALFEAKTVPEIVGYTGISRTGVLYELNKLQKKGFVKRIKNGKRYVYIAVTEDEFSTLIQRAVDEFKLKDSHIKGARVKTSYENEFIIHVGPKEILPAYQRIASKNRNTRIRAIQHHRSWLELNEKITPEQLVEFNRAIIKNKIILDGMLNESAYESYKKEILQNPQKHKQTVESLRGRMADYTVFADTFFNCDSEIWIFQNTALIINWKEDVAIEITNQNITKFLTDMFEFVKMGGKKIDHNRVIENVLMP